ncbi:MAG TPA: alpha/beta hydrolase [Candidatus Tectomicrobia bacterium]|jgi:acetyl esterase|nr:alpha/beta hydrolase [Candidatus Tectomicrobia bacterium]
MPLDPQAKQVLDQLAALGLPPNHLVSPAQARLNMKSRPRAAGPEVAKVEDRLIPGPRVELPVRIYTPAGAGPFPILLWYHGGGWVVGDLDTADPTARHLAVGADCVVVSVDYRLAPETKFPGAADDCYAATVWAAQNAARINGDPQRIAVGGDSAGGNLAAAVALMARDRGGLSLAFQLLVYPVTACNFETTSYRQNAEGYSLTLDGMRWYWDQYLQNPGDASNPYAAPLTATDLKGLPPALVITAEYDPLCDDGAAYARHLQAAGVATTYTCYAGMIHGFFGMAAVLDKSQQAIAEACAALRQAFAAAPHAAVR